MLCLDQEPWRCVGIDGRDVVVVFDSDAAVNREVAEAERALEVFLSALGARVRVVHLPGTKTGLDDYLAADARRPTCCRSRGSQEGRP